MLVLNKSSDRATAVLWISHRDAIYINIYSRILGFAVSKSLQRWCCTCITSESEWSRKQNAQHVCLLSVAVLNSQASIYAQALTTMLVKTLPETLGHQLPHWLPVSWVHPVLPHAVLWVFCQLPVSYTRLLAMKDNLVEDHCLQTTLVRGIFCNTLYTWYVVTVTVTGK